MTTIHRRAFGSAALAFAALPMIGRARAGTYPDRVIRIIAPYAPGGAVDIISRALAEQMRQSLKQTVIVENRVGGAGNLGVAVVAKSPPDGYTVSVTLSSNLMINQFLYTKLPYKPDTDLTMVAKIADAPLVLLVNGNTPVKNGAELRAWMAQNKGKLTYGSWGAGTIAHMSASRISAMLDADMVHVPYKGEAPMIQDLVAGLLSMSFATAAQARQFAKAGALRAIAVTGPTRLSVLPDVPTLAEEGFIDAMLQTVGWLGMAVPGGTPQPIVAVLSEAVGHAVAQPEVRARILDLGWTPSFQDSAAIQATYRREAPIWRDVVRAAAITLD